MDAGTTTKWWREIRPPLLAYLLRFTGSPQNAEDLAQMVFLRALEAPDRLPTDPSGFKAWIFRVSTNLAIDMLRHRKRWQPIDLVSIRAKAEDDPAFVSQARSLIGSPEMKNIAREHLAACFSCVLRSQPERRAAALLLREMAGFTTEESAEILEVSAGQVKNWLQQARAEMTETFGRTCALVAKQGVCHQCVELSDHFEGDRAGRDPLAGTDRGLDARLSVLREMQGHEAGRWQRMILEFIERTLAG